MSIQSALMDGRTAAELRMVSACTITRVTGSSVDPATGAETPTVETIYTGKCEVQFGDSLGHLTVLQGQQLAVQSPTLKLPIDGSAGVKTGDVATLTAHPLDVGKVGMVLKIVGDFTRDYATARRLQVEVP